MNMTHQCVYIAAVRRSSKTLHDDMKHACKFPSGCRRSNIQRRRIGLMLFIIRQYIPTIQSIAGRHKQRVVAFEFATLLHVYVRNFES
jgi:hypothetical protein